MASSSFDLGLVMEHENAWWYVDLVSLDEFHLLVCMGCPHKITLEEI